MRKIWHILAVLVMVVGMGLMVHAGPADDYQVIKKATSGKSATTMADAKWFKVEVRDSQTGKVKVKITIPVSLLEVVSTWCPDGKLKVDQETGMQIDLKQLVNELKKVGPMAYLEVCEDNETVKIWVE